MLSAAEVTDIRTDAEATMESACLLIAPTTTQAVDGEPVVSFDWEAAASSACGFRESTGRTRYLENGVLIEADARLRLPVGTTLAAGWGVRLVSRYGQTLSVPLDFAVMTEPAGGMAGIVVDLRRFIP